MNPLPENRKSLSLFLLLIFCFSLILCSCSNSNNKITDHSAYIEGGTIEDDKMIEECNVVLPSDASPELIMGADRLALALADRFGIKSTVYYDSEPLPRFTNTRFIFLGNTSYDISKFKISRFKIDDYVCVSVENDIVLGGKSSSATVSAIERFISDVLPYFDIQGAISDELSFEYHGEYLYTNITVNGHSLDDYTIAYPSAADAKEKAIAYALRDRLAKLCGAYPDIVDSRYVASTDRTICVGSCFGDVPRDAQILSVGSNIILCGDSANLIAESAEHFVELCSADTSLEIIGQAKPESQMSTLTLAAEFPVIIQGPENVADYSELFRKIKQNMPSVVCFDIPGNAELLEIKKNLTEYSYAGHGLFILSDAYAEMSITDISGGVRADLSLGKSYQCRIIAADASKCSSDTVSESISDDIPTVIFSLNDSEDPLVPADSQEILNEECLSKDRQILVKVIAPDGTAVSNSDFTITFIHSFLR